MRGKKPAARLAIAAANEGDTAELARLHAKVAEALTRAHGTGRWSSPQSERAVLRALQSSQVFVARTGGRIAGTYRLARKKPWAIDLAYFTPVQRPSYLHDLAVDPDLQRQGIGRLLLAHAVAFARDVPSDSIRLDAYDAPAGAADFYAAFGFQNRGRKTYRTVPLVYFELLLDERGNCAP